MARTAKAESIGKEKDNLILAIDRLRVQIKAAANSVPDSVLYGDSVISAQWRLRAEHAYYHDGRVVNKRKTLDELKAILADEERLLSDLRSPNITSADEEKGAAQTDLFA